jgi:hypothetical protein
MISPLSTRSSSNGPLRSRVAPRHAVCKNESRCVSLLATDQAKVAWAHLTTHLISHLTFARLDRCVSGANLV